METGGGNSPSERRRARHALYAGAAGNHASSPAASQSSPGQAAPNRSRTSALDRARARSAQRHQQAAQAAEAPSPKPAEKAGAAAVTNKPTIAERNGLPALELSVPYSVSVDIAPSGSSDVSGLTFDNAHKSGPSSGRPATQETPSSLYRIPEQSRSSGARLSVRRIEGPNAPVIPTSGTRGDIKMQRREEQNNMFQTPEQFDGNKRDSSLPVSQDRSPLQFVKNATASKATPDGTIGHPSLSPCVSPSLAPTKSPTVAVPATARRVVAQAVHRDPRHPGISQSPSRSPQREFLMSAFASASSILGTDGPKLPFLGSGRDKGAVLHEAPLPTKKSQTDSCSDAERPTRMVDLQPNFSRESNISADKDANVVDAELLDSVGIFIDSLNGHGQQLGAKKGQIDVSSFDKTKSPGSTRHGDDFEDAAAAIDDIRSDEEEEEEKDAAATIDESRSTDDDGRSEEGGNEVDPTIRKNIGAFIDSLQIEDDTADAFVLDINALEAATWQVDHAPPETKEEVSPDISPCPKDKCDDMTAMKESALSESGTSDSGVRAAEGMATVTPQHVDGKIPACNKQMSTSLRAIQEYKKANVPAEGLSPRDEEMLELFVGKTTHLLENKVPIKEAAERILRSSRKHGVADDVIIKIFQAIKIVGYETRRTEDQPKLTQPTKDVEEVKSFTCDDQEKSIKQASSNASDDVSTASDEERFEEGAKASAPSSALVKSKELDEKERFDSDHFQTKTVAELRNVNGGDMELYLMDEDNVEVAYIDEASEADVAADDKDEEEKEDEAETSHTKSRNSIEMAADATEEKDIPADTSLNGDGEKNSSKQHLQRKSPRSTKGSTSIKRMPDKKTPAADETYEYYQPGEPVNDFKKMIRRQRVFQNQPPDNCSALFGGVAAAIAITQRTPRHKKRSNKMLYSKRPVYRCSYEERTRDHPGYSDIDIFSLSDATAINQESHRLDEESWEDRDVKQRFLHEKSISLTRNWFGSAPVTRGNDLNFEPVCHPKSMAMPLDQLKQRLPQPDDWEEEWYMSWKSRKENPDALFSSSVTKKKENQERNIKSQVRDKYALDDGASSFSNDEENAPDDKAWKDCELGKLYTTVMGDSFKR